MRLCPRPSNLGRRGEQVEEEKGREKTLMNTNFLRLTRNPGVVAYVLYCGGFLNPVVSGFLM